MKEGIELNHYDPKPEIRRNAENARDWEYRDEAEYLYGMAVCFKTGFLIRYFIPTAETPRPCHFL
jgi:hypothetical protein